MVLEESGGVMAAKNLTREQAFEAMAKGRRCVPPGFSKWVTGNTGDGDEFVDRIGCKFSRVDFGYPDFATGWRLLKDLPPRAELVRELAAQSAWRDTLVQDLNQRHDWLNNASIVLGEPDWSKLDGAASKLVADLATTKAALAEALARPVPRFAIGDKIECLHGVGTVREVRYMLVEHIGAWPESELTPAPTAKPEPAWVDCGAAEAREKLLAGYTIRQAGHTGTRRRIRTKFVDENRQEAPTSRVFCDESPTGWQWQEVGQ